jgi:hypothetical protein
MSLPKSNILQRIASHVNGNSIVPVGADYNQWSDFLEESQSEWYNSYDPHVLIKTYPTTLQASGTSLALPDDFKEKFAGFIIIDGNPLEEFDPVVATIAQGAYVTWGGNQADGYYMTTPAYASLVSVLVPYHSRATALATLTSISPIPDPEFLIDRTTEKIMLQRGQSEYVEFQAKADLLLQRMVANEVSADMQKNNTIRTTLELNNFTLGDD